MTNTATAQVVLTKRRYTRLLTDLRRLLEEGRARADEAVSRELLRTYHALGTRILVERLSERAGYGSSILKELADGLGLKSGVLYRAVAFARLYPEPPGAESSLRWAHYRELVRVKDEAARSWYEQKAQQNGWTTRKLAEAIRHDAHGKGQGTSAKHAPQRRKATLPRPKEATYVYKARVERVVDGDTVILLVDLGFDVLKRQRLRLARLDTPPLREVRGREARDFVRDTLAQVDFVVVKTNKVDLYGRYVGHVFYAPGVEEEQQVFAKGRYLNQELVKRGLAEQV